MGSKQWFGKKMPVLAMISLQFVYASMALATKASLDKGFRPIIFLVYRQTASSVLLAPLSIFITLRRKPDEKSMGMKGFFLVSMAALIGVTMSANFYYEGLKLASATIASAMSNLVPAETFLIAAAVGLEKVKLGNIRSMAKVVGTIICVCGAIIMVLLKGQKLMNTELKRIIIVNSFLQESGDNKWLLGCFFLIASSTCWSAWLIIQMPICRNHLDPLLLSTWMSVISAFQTAALALFIEPDWRLWRPDSAFSILLCFYTLILSAVSSFFHYSHSCQTTEFSEQNEEQFQTTTFLVSSFFCQHSWAKQSLSYKRGKIRVRLGHRSQPGADACRSRPGAPAARFYACKK